MNRPRVLIITATFTDAADHRYRSGSWVAPVIAAATAWISFDPYFFWGSSRALLLASMLSGVVAVLLYIEGVRPRWRTAELAGVLVSEASSSST